MVQHHFQEGDLNAGSMESGMEEAVGEMARAAVGEAEKDAAGGTTREVLESMRKGLELAAVKERGVGEGQGERLCRRQHLLRVGLNRQTYCWTSMVEGSQTLLGFAKKSARTIRKAF